MSGEDRPLVLIETTANRQMVVAACRIARGFGVRCGMSFTEARALCPNLVQSPFEPRQDLRGLEALGRWMMRFSPIVALEPPDALLIDISGCERLFGSLERIGQYISESLTKLRIAAHVAIAPTPGAAWAVARSMDRAIVKNENLISALAPLPPDALRIDSETADALHRLGIVTIQQLMKLPRQTLPSRFHGNLLKRLDQALGNISEPLVGLKDRQPIVASMEFDGTISSLDSIWHVLGQLIGQIIPELRRRGCGARQIRLICRPPYAQAVEKTIRLSRPSRNRVNLFNLLRCALETVQVEEGFCEVRLGVPVYERLDEEQIALLEHEEHDARLELEQLVERLSIRLGTNAIQRAELIESYIPERAVRYFEACDASAGASACTFTAPRPMHLLNRPLEIGVIVLPSENREGRPVSFTHKSQVHRLPIAVGPERIAGQWWDGQDKTRDYFDVEDEGGQRFWIFRVMQTWKWYLHGEFE